MIIKKIFLNFITFSLLLTLISCDPSLDELKKITIGSIDFSKYKDGVYRGTYSDGKHDFVTDSSILSKKITDISVIENKDNHYSKDAEAVLPRVVEKQSLQVDTVSGCTLSSKALLKSIENAFK
jgi:uncharacterized protein with FMN-binding domain